MLRSAQLNLEPASVGDVAPLAALHTVVARHLTETHGQGPWSSETSEKGVLHAMHASRVFVARLGPEIVGTLRLTARKPWAIDLSYFSACRRPLYLLAMAIIPHRQRQGFGRQCLLEAVRIAQAWPSDMIRLDAHDAKAGDFYARCGWAERGHTTYRGAPLVYYELPLP